MKGGVAFLRACMRATRSFFRRGEVFSLKLVCAFEILQTVENSRIVVEKKVDGCVYLASLSLLVTCLPFATGELLSKMGGAARLVEGQ